MTSKTEFCLMKKFSKRKKKKVKKFIEKKMFIVIQAKVKMRILNFMKTEI